MDKFKGPTKFELVTFWLQSNVLPLSYGTISYHLNLSDLFYRVSVQPNLSDPFYRVSVQPNPTQLGLSQKQSSLYMDE